jgi:Fe-S-cluster formation regulator IscX/YfhJ
MEAIDRFQFADNHLWIIDTGHFTRPQFESVIEPSHWKTIRFYDFRYKLTHLDFGKDGPANLREHILELYLQFNQVLQRRRADRMAHNVGPVDNLFLGNYRRDYDCHMRHIANRLRFNRLFVLDVGTDILRVNMDRKCDYMSASTPIKATSQNVLKRIKAGIKRAMLDWDTHGVSALTFFTSYDLMPYGQDSVVRNEYAYLKSVVADAIATNEVLFVGQPLVDQGYITSETFRASISRIRDFFDGKVLIYIPHPRESEAQLEVIRTLGLVIKRFSAPFEHAVTFSGRRPHCIAAFFSSALENSAAIFGDTLVVRAFRLPEAVLKKDRSEVGQVYRNFTDNRRATIEVVDIL